MIAWNTLPVIQQNAASFYKVVYALAGLYVWEWLTSLHFEWDYLTGRKKFRWPIIFYFLCRYCPMVLIGGYFAQILSIYGPMNCSAVYTSMHISGSGSIALASMNFAFRTMALWPNNWIIKVLLTAMMLAQWILIISVSGYTFKAQWIAGIGCFVGPPDTKADTALFVYALVFDMIILSLALYKLTITSHTIPRKGQSKLRYILFSQGISYFLIMAVLNLGSVVFLVINLNMVMVVIFAVPADIFAPLVACRMVRELLSYAYSDRNVTPSPGPLSAYGSHRHI